MSDYEKLNLSHFFESIQDEIYCVIKLDERFPDYLPGSDIDIFIYNERSFFQKILHIANSYVEKGYRLKVSQKERKIVLDFYRGKDLEFRFDLYSTLPCYQNVNIKEGFFHCVIENRVLKKIEFGKRDFSLFVPSEIEELILRYIEYQEWYELRPDKIKHIDFIMNYFNDFPEKRREFFQKLHHFIGFPDGRAYGRQRFTPLMWMRWRVKEKVKETLMYLNLMDLYRKVSQYFRKH